METVALLVVVHHIQKGFILPLYFLVVLGPYILCLSPLHMTIQLLEMVGAKISITKGSFLIDLFQQC